MYIKGRQKLVVYGMIYHLATSSQHRIHITQELSVPKTPSPQSQRKPKQTTEQANNQSQGTYPHRASLKFRQTDAAPARAAIAHQQHL